MRRHILLLIVLVIFWRCNPSVTDNPSSNTTDEHTPMIWSGANQQIRVNERLNDSYGYAIIVRAIDEGTGTFLDGQTIRFEINESPAGSNPTFFPSLTTQTLSGLQGTVFNNNFMTDQIGTYRLLITHQASSGDKSKLLSIYVIEDEEESDFSDPAYTHEKYQGNEILGDGFEDFYEEGDDQFVKNVYVELDYRSSLDGDVDEIITTAEAILNTGGMKAKIIKDQALSTGSGSTDLLGMYNNRYEMKSILKNTRQKNDHIHAILATDHTNSDLYGYTVQYYGSPPDGEGWTHLKCARGASGFSDGDPAYSVHFRDSTGCMIFVDNIMGFGNPTWNERNAVAWVLAHEVGHALGYSSHYNSQYNGEYSIMHIAPFTGSSNLFGNYDQFVGPELDQGKDNSINVRDILGRDNIDIKY